MLLFASVANTGIPFIAKIWAIRAAACLAGWQLRSAHSNRSSAPVSILITALCKQSITEQKTFKEPLGGLHSLECNAMWIKQAGHKFPLVRQSVIVSAQAGSYIDYKGNELCYITYVFCLCVNLKGLEVVRKVWEAWWIHHGSSRTQVLPFFYF